MIEAIDHFVLTVASIADSCAFYKRALGIEAVSFGHGRTALQIGGQKINLHEAGREFHPNARVATPGSGDFCLVASEPVEAIAARWRNLGIAVEDGPGPRTGARGPMVSIYCRDPDGNLVEVSNYP
jgi:catechol 2,3-dioxygenase-like lactoylglutathione lyase family enzyme